jgi:hypothetical protein
MNQTNFIVQDNYLSVLEFLSFDERVDRIALFTDGIEQIVLDFRSQTVNPPYLRPIFEWLAKTELPQKEGPSTSLVAFLTSPIINSRTDDDKTLVMAIREPKDDA